MKRTFYYILASLIAVLLFGGLVHIVLVAANVSEPAATTVYGTTPRRVWAVILIAVALIGIVIGGLSQRQARIGTLNGRIMAILAMLAGLISVVNSFLNLATAEGGPGTGNGVVGSAMAIVLGAIGIGLGAIAFVRSERITKGTKNQI